MGKRAKTNKNFVDALERRQFVVDRRIAGDVFWEIKDAAIEKWGVDRLPKHWDELYAYKDLKIWMDKTKKHIMSSLEDHILLQLARIEKLIQVLWDRAVPLNKEDPVRITYIDRIERLMQRKAKLLGLDSATVFELTGKDGGPIDFKFGAARDTIIGRLLQPAPFGDEDGEDQQSD